jgi:Golgi phosphoprotein 3 (GPP34)
VTDLAEELLLLAYDETGVARFTPWLDFGMAGALLIELTLAERIAAPDKTIVVTDRTPIGDPLVDQALTTIAAREPGRSAKDWIIPLGSGLRAKVLDRLVSAGVLQQNMDKVLGIFPRYRYPTPTGREAAAETDARRRVTAAVANPSAPVADRTAALCALLLAADLGHTALPGLKPEEAKARLKAVSEGDWGADAVRKAINEMLAVMIWL